LTACDLCERSFQPLSSPHHGVSGRQVAEVPKLAGLSSSEAAALKKYEASLIATPKQLMLDPLRGRDPYRARFNQ